LAHIVPEGETRMSQPDLATRLNEAIALINAGRRAEAQVILLALSQQYPGMDQVWMWLAAATDDTDERIGYLRRVLSINPLNEKARAALIRLTGETPPPGADRPVPSHPPAPRAQSWESALIGVLLVIVVIVVIVVITVAISNLQQPRPTSTPAPTLTFRPIPTATDTATITPGGPTLTPVVGMTLPPSWTPIPSLTPVPTRTRAEPTLTFTPSTTYTRFPTITLPPTTTLVVSPITPGPTRTPYPTDLVSFTPQPTTTRTPGSP
jgi:hypothetical protein